MVFQTNEMFSNFMSKAALRTVPPFVTAHTFCASRDGTRNSGVLRAVPTYTKIFLRGL